MRSTKENKTFKDKQNITKVTMRKSEYLPEMQGPVSAGSELRYLRWLCEVFRC